ncbi:hypothetical protein PGT21_002748 [Puccinia graminis f. sp. tritici]|uniref:Uncharacterized protein n=1 Tax=Puccinia graminis f. sp. tritici TaxID=56615 RepID=A0A5B0PSQ6_PUCGR|nr:hypothetical protein PGT21_002748 [Puccinia graminis f. sp. tritici]
MTDHRDEVKIPIEDDKDRPTAFRATNTLDGWPPLRDHWAALLSAECAAYVAGNCTHP